MLKLKKIKSDASWGEVVDAINGNNSAINTEAETLKFANVDWGEEVAFPIIKAISSNATLQHNTCYLFGEVEELNITLDSDASDFVKVYMFQFHSGATPTKLSVPSDVEWANAPIIMANRVYQVTIIDGYATYREFLFNTAEMPTTEIWYTSSDGAVVEPYSTTAFGATYESNTYKGKGVMTFTSEVTKIGADAFRDKTTLTSATPPNSITAIGNNAFRGCTSLVSFHIPDGVTTLGQYAFNGCTSLRNFYIGKKVTSIGSYAFENCVGSLYINSNTIASKSYPSWYNRPTTGDGWLSNAKFSKLIFGRDVESIGSFAFVTWAALQEIDFSNAIKLHTLSNDVFGGSSITNITLPKNLRYIRNTAFENCKLLEAVAFANNSSLLEIGDYAFRYCDKLKSVNIPDSVTEIGDEAFRECTSLTSITIPDGVTSIGGLAFRGCYSLENISFGKSIKEISWSSFSLLAYQVGQDVKAHINIGSNVKTIAGYAFEGRRIDSLTIPANVEKIEDTAFSAASISNLWFEGKTNVLNFVAASIGNIYVPNEYVDFYKQQLYNYTSVIKGYDLVDAHTSSANVKGEIKAMSFNISVNIDAADTNGWANRREACYEMIREQRPTIIGLQETMLRSSWADLYGEFVNGDDCYDGFNVVRMDNGRVPGKWSEGLGILYDRRLLTLNTRGNFWLSIPSTPPLSSSNDEAAILEPDRDWFGAQYRRVANWAIFTHKDTGKTICYINTHLDTRPNATSDKTPRPKEMQLIMQKFAEFGGQCDYWILGGDMNAQDGTEETLNIAYANGLKNTRSAASDKTDNNRTYNGFSASGGGVIDHVLCSKDMEVLEYHTVNGEYGGIEYLSDHYPIYSVIKLK